MLMPEPHRRQAMSLVEPQLGGAILPCIDVRLREIQQVMTVGDGWEILDVDLLRLRKSLTGLARHGVRMSRVHRHLRRAERGLISRDRPPNPFRTGGGHADVFLYLTAGYRRCVDRGNQQVPP